MWFFSMVINWFLRREQLQAIYSSMMMIEYVVVTRVMGFVQTWFWYGTPYLPLRSIRGFGRTFTANTYVCKSHILNMYMCWTPFLGHCPSSSTGQKFYPSSSTGRFSPHWGTHAWWGHPVPELGCPVPELNPNPNPNTKPNTKCMVPQWGKTAQCWSWDKIFIQC